MPSPRRRLRCHPHLHSCRRTWRTMPRGAAEWPTRKFKNLDSRGRMIASTTGSNTANGRLHTVRPCCGHGTAGESKSHLAPCALLAASTRHKERRWLDALSVWRQLVYLITDVLIVAGMDDLASTLISIYLSIYLSIPAASPRDGRLAPAARRHARARARSQCGRPLRRGHRRWPRGSCLAAGGEAARGDQSAPGGRFTRWLRAGRAPRARYSA
jgi:hypothetical protein